jgi:hypothetical protein
MRLVRDGSWGRRGVTLLWGPNALPGLAGPGEIRPIRAFFELAQQWPESLPSGSGSRLVVAGLEGSLDALTPDEAALWLEEDVRPQILNFQTEYDSQCALVFWLPSGRKRIRTAGATDAYSWSCAPPFADQILPLGRILWAGAEQDTGRILDPREADQNIDGPAWIGLQHPRIS